MNNINQSMFSYIKDRIACLDNKNTLMLFYGRKINKSLFFNEIDKLASYLQNIGVNKGDNVVICLGNIPNSIISFYAVNKIGAIANVIHPLIKEKELEKIHLNMKPKAYILFDEFYENYTFLKEINEKVILCGARDYLSKFLAFLYPVIAYKKLNKIRLSDNAIFYKDIKSTSFKEVEVNGNDIAIYMHSSGTSGEPKIACLSNIAFNSMAYEFVKELFDEEIDNSIGLLMALPIFHTFGLGVCMHTTLAHGSKIILMPKFNANYVSLLMRFRSINVLAGIPNMYKKLANCHLFFGKNLKKLKICVCGGDKLPKTIKNSFENKLKKYGNDLMIEEGYGLTEAGILCMNRKKDYKEDSIGTPFNNVKFKILDENKVDLGFNKVGTIYVTSTSLMDYYFDDIEETEKITFLDSNNNRWLNTGDIGYLDESNHLFFKDREKRIIKISGINVFPQEIEDLVNRIDSIQASCAVEKNIDGKKIIRLYVEMKKNEKLNKDIIDKIKLTISQHLMKYNMPSQIIQVDKLIYTQIGKVDFIKMKNL